MPSDTPPTGTAVPRPKKVEGVPALVQPAPTVSGSQDAFRPPPTLEDVYKLIEARLTPEIISRISSIPPPESRPSMPVRAAKATGRWTKWAMVAIGALTLVGELFADVEKYRGPIGQALTIIARVLDAQEAPAIEPVPAPLESQ